MHLKVFLKKIKLLYLLISNTKLSSNSLMAGKGELRAAREALAEVTRELAGYPIAIPEDTKLPDLEQAGCFGYPQRNQNNFDEINTTIGSLSGKLDT